MELKANERIDDLQRGGLRVIQRTDAFRFGTDAVLLSKGRAMAAGSVETVFAPEHLNAVYDMDVADWMRRMLAQWQES